MGTITADHYEIKYKILANNTIDALLHEYFYQVLIFFIKYVKFWKDWLHMKQVLNQCTFPILATLVVLNTLSGKV